MSELKPGVLALIIGSRYESTRANIGKIVEVISLEPSGEVLSKGESLVDKQGNPVQQALCLNTHLLPIKAEPDPLTVTNKEELHE